MTNDVKRAVALYGMAWGMSWAQAPVRIQDGTSSTVGAVKAASTAAVAADPAQVVAISPNNTVAVTQASGNIQFSGNQPTIVQTINNTTNSGLTVVKAFASNTIRGDSLFAVCGGSNYAASNWTATVTDTQGNTYTQDILSAQSTTQWTAIFRSQSTVGGADTLTLTIAGSSSTNESIACQFYEVLGVWQPSQSISASVGSSNAGSTAVSAGSTNANSTSEIAFTGIASGNTSSPTITPGAGWVLDSGTLSPTSFVFGSESMYLTSYLATAITGNATLSVSNAWAAATAIYRTYIPSVLAQGMGSSGSSLGGVLSVQGAGTGMTPLNIRGAAGGTLDAAQGAAAPANELVAGGVYNSSLPSISSGDASQIQIDTKGQILDDLNYIAGSAAVTAAPGVLQVGVVGNAGAKFDQATGSAVPANAVQIGVTDGTNTRTPYMDPCGTAALTYYVVNVSSNTQIVAGSASKNVYVCEILFPPQAGAVNVNLVESATSNNACATSPTGMLGGATAALGANITANGGWVVSGTGTRALAKTATTADAMCIFASASVNGVIAYVQQ